MVYVAAGGVGGRAGGWSTLVLAAGGVGRGVLTWCEPGFKKKNWSSK